MTQFDTHVSLSNWTGSWGTGYVLIRGDFVHYIAYLTYYVSKKNLKTKSQNLLYKTHLTFSMRDRSSSVTVDGGVGRKE